MKQKKHNGYYVNTFTYEGRRHYIYAKSQTELYEKTVEKKKALENGFKARINPTVDKYNDYFTEQHIKTVKETTVRCERSCYTTAAAVELTPGVRFGSMKLKDITQRDINLLRQKLQDDGKTAYMINFIVMYLKQLFKAAVNDDTITKNPCDGIKPLKHVSVSGETIHRALTEEETAAFFKAAENSVYINLYKVMLLTGMRVGEVGALYLTDIDSEYIHVRRTLTHDINHRIIVGTDAKTKKGKRDIPMTDEIRDAIKNQRQQNNILYGLSWNGTLFKTVSGSILNGNAVIRDIERICKIAGIERITCHCFRATFATRFMEQRPQDFKILSEILGHATVKMTLDLYTKVMTDSKVKAMNAIKIKTV